MGLQPDRTTACRKTVHDYQDLIQAIATQEYDRLGQAPGSSFRGIVRTAALVVHIALLSDVLLSEHFAGQSCNANSLTLLMREAIRQRFHSP